MQPLVRSPRFRGSVPSGAFRFVTLFNLQGTRRFRRRFSSYHKVFGLSTGFINFFVSTGFQPASLATTLLGYQTFSKKSTPIFSVCALFYPFFEKIVFSSPSAAYPAFSSLSILAVLMPISPRFVGFVNFRSYSSPQLRLGSQLRSSAKPAGRFSPRLPPHDPPEYSAPCRSPGRKSPAPSDPCR